MEQKYKEYLNYNFANNEEYRRYIDAIEPPPPYSKIEYYKKKFYRLKVDKEFDIDYNPDVKETSPPPQQSAPTEATDAKESKTEDEKSSSSEAPKPIPLTTKIQLMLHIVFLLSFGFGYIIRSYYHPIPLCLAFLIGAFKKHGRPKFEGWYWRGLIADWNFHDLVTTIFCGISHSNTIAIWVPILIRSFIFIADFINLASRKGSGLAQSINKFTHSASEKREDFLTLKADLEVYIGFYVILALAMYWVTLMLPLFYWQLMQVKYLINPYTSIAFNKLAYQMDYIVAQPNCPFFIKWPLKGLRKLGSFLTNMMRAQPQAQS